jgi:hypothetical protein
MLIFEKLQFETVILICEVGIESSLSIRIAFPPIPLILIFENVDLDFVNDMI